MNSITTIMMMSIIATSFLMMPSSTTAFHHQLPLLSFTKTSISSSFMSTNNGIKQYDYHHKNNHHIQHLFPLTTLSSSLPSSTLSSSISSSDDTIKNGNSFSRYLNNIIPPKDELKKLIPLALMFFCILFSYTILRDTKDVLMITAPKSGAEVIPFIKTYCNLPIAIVSSKKKNEENV